MELMVLLFHSVSLLVRFFLTVSTRPNLHAIEKRRWMSASGVATS